MKTKKFLVLLALLVCFATLFIACGSAKALTFADIINPEWKPEKEMKVSTYKELSIVGVKSSSNTSFVVTVDANDGGNSAVTRVYGFKTEQVLTSFTNSVTVDATTGETTYNYGGVHLISDEYFSVLSFKMTGSLSGSSSSTYFAGLPLLNDKAEYTLSVYDENGNAVKELSHGEIMALCENDMEDFDSVYYTADDENSIIYEYKDSAASGDHGLVEIGNSIYKVDKDGNKTFIKSFDYQQAPTLTNVVKGGDYYYEIFDDKGLRIYNSALERIYLYAFPSYVENADIYILANGNALLQYEVLLNFEASNYDFRDEGFDKYDLVTKLIDPVNMTMKDLKNVDFRIVYCTSAPEFNEDKIYNDTLQNVAMVSYIKDKLIDTNYTVNGDMIAFNNDLSTINTFDFGVDVLGVPTPISANYYSAYSKHGDLYVFDKEGKLVNTYDAMSFGEYFYTDNAIYFIDGTEKYNLKDNKATVDICGNSLIISKTNGKVVEKLLFRNGNVTPIANVSADTEVSSINGFAISGDCYYTYNAEENKYTYYNECGERLGSFDSKLSTVSSTDDYIIMVESTAKRYFKFSLSEITD